MFDNEIAEVLRKTYGDENFKIFCEMQVTRNRLADQELRSLGEQTTDANYEAFFWKVKLDEILKQENH